MEETETTKKTYAETEKHFIHEVLEALDTATSEVAQRNDYITERDDFVYGDRLERSLKIPIGHDRTNVNWLRRAVEIHKDQFMGRGFQMVSTYNTRDISAETDPEEQGRVQVENKRSKEYSEQRQNTIQNIIDDNGGNVLFQNLAESASAIGSAVIKMYYDEDAGKLVISPVESVENVYAVWSQDDFRVFDGIAYVRQISKRKAIADYGVDEDVPTSPLGQPTKYITNTQAGSYSTQPMVTVIEYTGYVCEYQAKNGKLIRVPEGKESELNAVIVGNKVVQLIGERKKLPKYYILPNKRVRRRPWGVSDLSDAAISINLTYIETLSDWRTVASKVNFPKIKAFGFVPGSELPKPKPRTSELIPLSDGQDLQPLNQGDANQVDFNAQLEELKEQFVRETGISRVFFNDPSVALNSNQALMTSLKPTTDIAEAKKSLWGPILVQLFTDALEMIAEYDPTVKELIESDDDWKLKIMWPSTLQKEDPVYQQMLLNRFNANTISLQSYLEAQGETKEELDRIREEMENPVTAAILAKAVGQLYGAKLQAGMQQAGFIDGGQPAPQPGNPNGGGDMRGQVATQGENVPGAGVISQPGSGATPVSPEGAVAQNAQTNLGA